MLHQRSDAVYTTTQFSKFSTKTSWRIDNVSVSETFFWRLLYQKLDRLHKYNESTHFCVVESTVKTRKPIKLVKLCIISFVYTFLLKYFYFRMHTVKIFICNLVLHYLSPAGWRDWFSKSLKLTASIISIIDIQERCSSHWLQLNALKWSCSGSTVVLIYASCRLLTRRSQLVMTSSSKSRMYKILSSI